MTSFRRSAAVCVTNRRNEAVDPHMKLSVCLIVKDEEPVLERCLRCAEQIADELIVVDTGSRDRSVEIARRFTDRVFLHPWQNSFAEARNYSFDQASGDYIMWLDADDVILPEDIRRLLRLKEELPGDTDVVCTTYKNYSEDGIYDYILRDRIFRRMPELHWIHDVHEAVPIRPEWKSLDVPDVSIIHKKERVNEPGRNLAIFERVLREGRELSVSEKSHLCRDLLLGGRYEDACALYEELRDAPAPYRYYAMFHVREALLRLHRYEDCLRELEEMDKRIVTAFSVYWQGLCLESLGRYDEARERYLRAQTIPEDPTAPILQVTGYTDYFPLLRLAALSMREGDIAAALSYIETAGARYPRHPKWQTMRRSLSAWE